AGDGVPADRLLEVDESEDDENGEGDDFLERLELGAGQAGGVADAIGGDLETVLEKGDPPAHEDDEPERAAGETEVAVPREAHEDVGGHEEQDGPEHGESSVRYQVSGVGYQGSGVGFIL